MNFDGLLKDKVFKQPQLFVLQTIDLQAKIGYNTYSNPCTASLCASVADVLCTSCNIDGCVKMPLQASIFT